MGWLIAARFVMGCGLGAEIVVGYVTLSEFLPPKSRGRWGTGLAVMTNSALFVSALVARAVIPNWGWRWMFVLVGVGALVVWYARKKMPESPRWLEAAGRTEEAEEILSRIEREVAETRPLPAPAPSTVVLIERPSIGTLFSQGLLMRTLIGSLILIALNTAIYGFIAFLPTFMVRQGMSIVTSLNYTMLMSFGGPVGAVIGMFVSDYAGRKRCIVWGSVLAILFGALYPYMTDPNLVTLVGFLLVTSVYVLVAIAWGLYVPELFPTDVRMRGAGFCNTAGRMMTILTPQIVVPLFAGAGIGGVIGFVGTLLVLQAVMVALFGIETKQKSLEALVPQQRTVAEGVRSPADAV
jgi:putative MFS transporter